MDFPVVLVNGVGDGRQVDHGVAALEDGEGRVVVAGDVGGAHLCVGRVVFFCVGSVDLDGVVACFGAELDDLLTDCTAGACNGNLHHALGLVVIGGDRW